MSDAAERRRERVVAYLLGELDAGGALQFEREVSDDEALRAELDALRPTVTRLAELPPEAWDAPQPPPLRLPEPDARAPAPGRERLRGWGRVQIAIATGAVAAAALAVGIGIGALLDDDPSSETGAERIAALDPVKPSDTRARGELAVRAGGQAELEVRGLRPNRGDYYELWLLGDHGLVALGTFRVNEDGVANVPVTLPVDPGSYQAFDVSREPDDGDPSHSGDSVLRGPT